LLAQNPHSASYVYFPFHAAFVLVYHLEVQFSYQLSQRDFYDSLIAIRNRKAWMKWTGTAHSFLEHSVAIDKSQLHKQAGCPFPASPILRQRS
jgi:hypothetical protein